MKAFEPTPDMIAAGADALEGTVGDAAPEEVVAEIWRAQMSSKPTRAMIIAGVQALEGTAGDTGPEEVATEVWRAMVAARAPEDRRPGRYYALDGKEVVALDAFSADHYFGTPDHEHREVIDELRARERYLVETAFLGVIRDEPDGKPPRVFETVIRAPKSDTLSGMTFRCASYAEAEAQHARVVAAIEGPEPLVTLRGDPALDRSAI